jgi:phage terminase large subunit
MISIKTTKVFEDLITTDKRICVFQGSSRASKTYNILIYWVYKLLQEDGKTLSIVRKTLPALKGSVLRDLKEILINFGLYNSDNWHSVDGYYQLGTNIIEWFSLDSEEKLRGTPFEKLVDLKGQYSGTTKKETSLSTPGKKGKDPFSPANW